MKNPTVQAAWRGFRNQTIQKNASKVQIEEMRQSFYAGAFSLMNILDAMTSKNISEEVAAHMLENLHHIIDVFFNKGIHQASEAKNNMERSVH